MNPTAQLGAAGWRGRLAACFVACLLGVLGAAQPTVLYSTGFEPTEGFVLNQVLIGQRGWLGTDVKGNGITTNYFEGEGQHAYVGVFALTTTNDSLSVWHPINYAPTPTRPIVRFTTTMAVYDSTTGGRDCFRWSVYNTNSGGTRLFTIDFDNSTEEISYVLDDAQFVSTGFSFARDGIYDLGITMNFLENRWSATLNGTVFVSGRPITTAGSALNLGDIDAVWLHRVPGQAGDNFMVFDNYRVEADAAAPLPFRLESLGYLQSGVFLLRLTGDPGRRYVIEASETLAGWTAIRTNIAEDGGFDFADTNAALSAHRFYRARLAP